MELIICNRRVKRTETITHKEDDPYDNGKKRHGLLQNSVFPLVLSTDKSTSYVILFDVK